MTPALEFWFEFASTYSYLAAGRIEAVAGGAVEIAWKPFLLGPIFAADRDISSVDVIVGILEELGQSGRETIVRAESTDNKNRLRRQNERAVELGIFGAPSFVAAGELFWGDDRLAEAIACAKARGNTSRT